MANSPIQLANDSFEELFSRAEALEFIRDVLQVDVSDTVDYNGEERLNLLNQIIYEFHHQEPFNNLEAMALPRDQLQRPTAQQVKESMYRKLGGLCYATNTFLGSLLNAAGFKSYLSIGSVRGTRENHIVCYSENVKHDQDRYLVDVGMGMPTFEAIETNFTEESPIYNQSFQSFKYEWSESDRLSRIVTRGAGPQWDRRSDGSVKVYETSIYRKSLDEIRTLGDLVYGIPGYTTFLSNIAVVKFVNSKAYALRNYSLLVENSEGELDKTSIEPDLLSDTVIDLLPDYDHNIIEAAVKNYWNL